MSAMDWSLGLELPIDPVSDGSYGDVGNVGGGDINVTAPQDAVPYSYSPSIDGIPSYVDSTTGNLENQSSAPDPSSLPLSDPANEWMWSQGIGPMSTDSGADWETLAGATDPLNLPSGVSGSPTSTLSKGLWSTIANAVGTTAGVGAAVALKNSSVTKTTPAGKSKTTSTPQPGILSGNIAANTSLIGIVLIGILAVVLFMKVAK